MTMKKRITLTELKKINPHQYSRVLIALNRNRVQTSKKRKTNLEKHEIKNSYITLKLQ
jgi:hypothetical protein